MLEPTTGRDSEGGFKSKITECTDQILQLRSTNEKLHAENQILADKFNKLADYNQVLGDDLANFDDEIVYMEQLILRKNKRLAKLSRKVDSVNRSIDKYKGTLMDDEDFNRSVIKLKRIDDMRTAIFKRLQELKGDSWTPALEDAKMALLNEIEALEDEKLDLEEQQHILEILTDESISKESKQETVAEMLRKRESEQAFLLDEIEQMKEYKSRKIIRQRRSEATEDSESHTDEKDKEYHDKQRQVLLLKDPSSYQDLSVLFNDDVSIESPSKLEPIQEVPTQRSSSTLAKRKHRRSASKRASSSLSTPSPKEETEAEPDIPVEEEEVKVVCRVGIQDLTEAETQVDEEELDPVVRSRSLELAEQEKEATTKLEALQREIQAKREEKEHLLSLESPPTPVSAMTVRSNRSVVNIPPEPDAIIDLSLQVFEKHSKSVETDLTGNSIDFHIKLLQDQAGEMTVEAELQNSIETLREQIKSTTKKIKSAKKEGKEKEKVIERVTSDLKTAKRNIENEQAIQEEQNAVKRQISAEIEELKEQIKEKQAQLEQQTARNAAAGERLEELLRIRQTLERDISDLSQREKPEVQTLAHEVDTYEVRVRESRQRLATEEAELGKKRKVLDDMKHSKEMQNYKDLIAQKAKLDRRITKWKMLLKDSRETLQSLEVFSAQNAQRRQSLIESLDKYQRMKIDKEQDVRDLEDYSALLAALLEEQTKNWT